VLSWAFHISSVCVPILSRQRKFVSTSRAFCHAALNNRCAAPTRKGSSITYVKRKPTTGTMNNLFSISHRPQHSAPLYLKRRSSVFKKCFWDKLSRCYRPQKCTSESIIIALVVNMRKRVTRPLTTTGQLTQKSI